MNNIHRFFNPLSAANYHSTTPKLEMSKAIFVRYAASNSRFNDVIWRFAQQGLQPIKIPPIFAQNIKTTTLYESDYQIYFFGDCNNFMLHIGHCSTI